MVSLLDLGFNNGVLDITINASAWNGKINLEFIKIFCLNGHYQESKKQPIEWEIVFAERIPGKNLICRIFEDHSTSKAIQLLS